MFLEEGVITEQSGAFFFAKEVPPDNDLECIKLGRETVIIDPEAVYSEHLIFEDPTTKKNVICWNGRLNNYFNYLKYGIHLERVKILNLAMHHLKGGLRETIAERNELFEMPDGGEVELAALSYEDMFEEGIYSLAAVLSLHPRVSALSVDLTEPPENSQWLNAQHFSGSITDSGTRREAIRLLGGRPDIIIGEQVFVRGNNDLARAAFELVNQNGFVMVYNGYSEQTHCHGDGFLPRYLQERTEQMAYFYLTYPTRVYRATA